MTERLYLADSYLSRFTARVVTATELDGRPAAALDRSAFYPEGGGQPADRGSLGPARVLDVQEREGEVWHLLDRALAEGAEVEAAIDWGRRFDHMQQHHGQHLLSAAFAKLHGAATTSFHLGEKVCTIDLDCSVSALDSPGLRKVEAAANESVWRNVQVVARDFVGDERASLRLRKEPVKGDRVVLVEGIDASPCGGTHPSRTGEVGAIAVLRAQKWGAGKSRVEFICGGRVVRALAEAEQILAAAAEALRCAERDVAEAARRAAEEALSRRRAAEALERELAGLQAEQLVAGNPDVVVARVSRGPGMLRALAGAVAEHGRTTLLAAVDEGRAHLVFARPKGASGLPMNELLREVLQIIGGKGGGSADFAQGSGDPMRVDKALAAAAQRLRGS